MARERTFLMIKPDAIHRTLIGRIIKRLELKGFKLVAMKFIIPTESILRDHYEEHKGKPFFEGLIRFMQSGPVIPMVWEGENVIKCTRSMLGSTDPALSHPGTIRGDMCIQIYDERNVIHGSHCVEAANREIAIWFNPKEIIEWTPETERWIYDC